MTAAHVVTFVGEDGRLHVAGRVILDFGSRSYYADRIAIPAEYLRAPSVHHDVVVLGLLEDVCDPDWVLRVRPLAPQDAAPATIWGRANFDDEPVDVDAVRPGPVVQYERGDLPGHSGGPVVSPRPGGPLDLRGATCIAVHSRFRREHGWCEALPVSTQDLREALRALAGEP